MEDFLDQPDDIENIVTTESLAWKILMDDDVENYAGILLPTVLKEDSNITIKTNIDPNVRYDSLADQFQILISIYMEMVFNILKINHLNTFIDDDGNIHESVNIDDLDTTFNPDMTSFADDAITDVLRDKLKKIRIFLSVRGIYDSNERNPKDYGSNSDYYCRIILRDTPEGKTYYRVNYDKEWLDQNKRYTFVIRHDTKKKQKKLVNRRPQKSLNPFSRLKISNRSWSL